MSTLTELKQLLKLHEVRKIEPTDIVISVLNMAHGTLDRYKFKVQYIGKIPYGSHAFENDYPNHVVNVYGIITYDSGNSYKSCHKLTYTDDEELQKLIQPTKEGVRGTFDTYFDVLRLY